MKSISAKKNLSPGSGSTRWALALSLLLSCLSHGADAARSWTDVVPPSRRGYSDSSKGGPHYGRHSEVAAGAFEALDEYDPYKPFDDQTAPPTKAPTSSAPTSKSPTTYSPSLRPSTTPPVTESPTLGPTKDGSKSPTVSPTSKPTDDPTMEPSPSVWGVLEIVDECSSDEPCGPCQGRCGDDSDCLDGLVCLNREDESDPVPGCAGEPSGRRDYCVVPEGAWAAGWRFPTSSPTDEPSAKPSRAPTDSPTVRPSRGPTDEPTRAPVTDRPTFAPLPAAVYDASRDCGSDHHEKCGRCQGECNRDSHCHEGLKCMERNNNRRNRDVPGCVGEAESGVNYCYLDPDDAEKDGGWAAPTPTATPSASPSASPTISHQPTHSMQPSASPTGTPTRMPAVATDSFKLRMFWERGYDWQGDRRESDWCMERKSSKNLEIADCNGDSDQKFVEYAGTLRPAKNQDKCLTKDGNDVIVEDCKGELGGNSQQWILDAGQERKDAEKRPDKDAPYRRPYDILKELGKFEIHPKGDLGKCVTNHHQPRNGESLMVQDCVFPRRSKTNFWRLD